MDKGKRTRTKIVMDVILTSAIIDVQLSYILAFLGRDQIAETLAGIIVTEIIGVFVAYCMKSYFETKQSEKTRLAEKKLDFEFLEEVDDEQADI